ncbi:hypothetical protein [Limnobaculum xujianqingii]|uniref:hypothetical protein n=1 Tax=Limnobaculum xujianqingii TaxID=2738837 RepID=UPI0015B8B778|nr:hypothetical protein [Limnobaculum xujianqingii]
MISKKLKPFDLEAAKAGAPVITRDGCEVRIICFDSNIECAGGKYPIVALITDHDGGVSPQSFSVNGSCVHGHINEEDLFMTTIKREGYINIYPNNPYCFSMLYPSRENADQSSSPSRVACVMVEWEE